MAATVMTVERDPAQEPDHSGSAVPDAVRRRLAPSMPDDAATSWLWTILVAVVAAVLRLISVAHPRGVIFDETYYAKDAHDLLHRGVEWDEKINQGGFVVHPPLGKWCIALGEWAFGHHGALWKTPDEFAWRIPAVIAGVVSVVILIRLARRLFRSTVLGVTAGLLLTLDGMHFVSSRVALLDIFLMVFLLAAFACLVMDREANRRRWLAALEGGLDPTRDRPKRTLHTWPWWRLAAGVLAGCAMAVKWSAVWYLLAFVVVIFLWEVGTRRSAGAPRPWRDTLLDEIGWIAAFGGLILATYLASWTGWFLSEDGAHRHWLRDQGQGEWPVLGALYNLFQYHRDALSFHTNLDASHTYQSGPWQWLLLGRPVAYYWSSDVPCGADSCAAEIILLGTPLLWWAFIPALIATAWWAISRRDWRASAILLGAAMGIAPWLLFPGRTMFYFYALPSLPFLVLAVTFALGMIVGPAGPAAESGRRMFGAAVAGGYVALVALCFAFFYPLYTGESIPYQDWYSRIWLGRLWI